MDRINLTEKYRLIWNLDSSIIQNDYELDCTGSLTTIINAGDLGFFESDVYQDVLDKINSAVLSLPAEPELPEPEDI